MSLPQSHFRDSLVATLERLICAEFELMETCHEAAQRSHGEDHARLLHQAGLCQVHLFDLESSLLELAGRPAGYSTCVRRTLGSLGRRSFAGSLDKLLRRYDRARSQQLPPELRDCLADNEREHRQLAAAGARNPEALRKSA